MADVAGVRANTDRTPQAGTTPGPCARHGKPTEGSAVRTANPCTPQSLRLASALTRHERIATMDFGALVRAGSVPNTDAFFRADGVVRQVDYDGPRLSWFRLGPPFVPTTVEDDLDDLVEVDWADQSALASQSGSVCCGEGPMGSDGFFARLDPNGIPVWVVFMTNSNPFLHVGVNGTVATFTNNLDRSIVIDLELPDFAPRPTL